MNEKTKATIGSVLVAGSLLAGCSLDTKNNEKKDVYVEPDHTYTETMDRAVISEYKQVYEPGTHFVEFYSSITNNNPQNETQYSHYHQKCGDVLGKDYYNTNGFINNNVPVIEGYRLVDVEPYNGDSYYDSKTYGYVYIFVNTEKVEVTMYYDYDHNVVYYNEPGVVVKERTLN